MEVSDSSRGDDSLNVASKEWDRIIEAVKKSAYRQGVEDGSTSVLQKCFDEGYTEGFETAFRLGKYKSLLDTISQDTEDFKNLSKILDETRLGACYICTIEVEGNGDTEKTFSALIAEQRAYLAKLFETIDQYCQSYVNKQKQIS